VRAEIPTTLVYDTSTEKERGTDFYILSAAVFHHFHVDRWRLSGKMGTDRQSFEICFSHRFLGPTTTNSEELWSQKKNNETAFGDISLRLRHNPGVM
jgi:hypothetical protein